MPDAPTGPTPPRSWSSSRRSRPASWTPGAGASCGSAATTCGLPGRPHRRGTHGSCGCAPPARTIRSADVLRERARLPRVGAMLQPPAMAEISDEDLNRELNHLYEKRHDILRTGSADAWANHRERT